jgi:hypothetical protein
MDPFEPQHRAGRISTNLLFAALLAAILCISSALCARAQEAQPNSSNESWTATTETSVENGSPSRTTESHSKSGNRSVDKVMVEAPGPNGGYQPSYETEMETVEAGAGTTRTVERTYTWDVNGRRNLVQVTEEESQSSPSGEAHSTRTTSNPDGNGQLQVTAREVTDTRNTTPGTDETKTTSYFLDGDGHMAPFQQTHEVATRTSDDTVEVKKTTSQQDINGQWKVGEVRESTIKEASGNRTTDERVLRSDSGDRPSEVARTVTKETKNGDGQNGSVVETYSTASPGSTSDGKLRLNLRVSTIQKSDANGKTTEQIIEQPNPNDPSAGPQASRKTKYVVQYAASGTEQKKTIEARDANGNWTMVSSEAGKSDRPPAQKTPAASSENPK